MENENMLFAIGSSPFILDKQKRELRQYNRTDIIIPFDDFKADGPYYTYQLDNGDQIKGERLNAGNIPVKSVNLIIPSLLIDSNDSLPEVYKNAINIMSKRQGWGFFIADEPLAMRLSGKLPTIDLAGTNFTIDVRLRELRKTDSPWNAISFDQMKIGENGNSYELLFDTNKHTVYKPEKKGSRLPDSPVMLEIPKEKTLDPVAVARQYGIGLTDLLIDYPFQMNSAAKIKSSSKVYRQEASESLEADQNLRTIKRGR